MPLLDKKRFKCIVCKNSFTTLTSLQRHRRLHSGEKPYKCTQCDKKFTYVTALTHHQMVHTGDKPHQCTACGRTFSYLHHLQRHLRCHTGEKPHRCQQCGKRYQEVAQLTRHMLTHTGEKPHVCDVCDRGFTTAANMNSHRRTHTGEKPYVCTVCGLRFAHQGNLRGHIQRIHDKPTAVGKIIKNRASPNTYKIISQPCQHFRQYGAHKPSGTGTNGGSAVNGKSVIVVEKCSDCNKLFKYTPRHDTCTQCKKVFQHPHDLKKHSTAHPCSICHKSFCQLPYLNKHMITHADGFYHKCSECSRIFLHAPLYLDHMETHRETPPRKKMHVADCDTPATTKNRASDLTDSSNTDHESAKNMASHLHTWITEHSYAAS